MCPSLFWIWLVSRGQNIWEINRSVNKTCLTVHSLKLFDVVYADSGLALGFEDYFAIVCQIQPKNLKTKWDQKLYLVKVNIHMQI